MLKKTSFLVLSLFFIWGHVWGTKPVRIISLAPSLTESIFLLGAGEILQGCTTYCRKPLEAQKKEKVGSLIKFNLEKILTLEPDLVVAMEFADRKAVEKLRTLGIRIELFPSPKNFHHLCESFLRLGRIVNKEEQARNIIEKAKSRVAAIRHRTAKLPGLKIFWQLGAKPLFTVTQDYFTNDYIEFGGGINIAAQAKSGIYSREEVLKRNPDVIVIVTMGVVAKQEKQIWMHYPSIQAVQDDRIYVLDSYTYCSPTPAGFAQALADLVILLHPSLKEAESKISVTKK